MKIKFLIIAIILSCFKTSAQSLALGLEEMKHYRIQLDNRSNRHLKDLPTQLLEGYCKGFYKAYYPKAVFNEVNFGDFLAHFRWHEPVLNESVLCGDNYCSNPTFLELYSRFNVYIDYYEHTYFNTKTSRQERKIPFVQLVYSVELNGTIYSFTGPVFRMDELDKTIFIKNAINNSESQSLKYIFDLSRFHSVEITDAEIKSKEKRTNKEDNYQDH